MTESPTATTLHPAEDYEYLRSEGLAHIQRLSGALWSDYNSHDPGITMLEILCFALADIGFRNGHPIEDILAPVAGENPNYKQFFSINEIATTRPWSIQDYRSILIDLPFIANAWLSKSNQQEVGIALNETKDDFELFPNDADGKEGIRLNGLYEVAVRFEEDPEFGDLNDNSARFWDSILQDRPAPENEIYIPTEIEIEFPFQSNLSPRFHQLSNEDVDRFQVKRRGSISGETFGWYYTFIFRPIDAQSEPKWEEDEFVVAIRFLQGQDQLLQMNRVKEHLNLAWWKETLKTHYVPRRANLQSKLEAVKAKLLENRNLCEDFYAIVPMDLQEIALELDIEIANNLDLEDIEVAIYDQMRAFLDPPLRFYSLSEMLAKGYVMEEIFDGPVLENGFLDRKELKAHQARKKIHASDLAHLIMDIDGVTAIRKLRFVNRIAGEIVGSSEECLMLTEPGRFQANIDVRRSDVRFYKGRQAAEQADKLNVLQKYRAGLIGGVINKGIVLREDLPIETGRNRQLDAYYSIQEDFPLAWGIGSFGLSESDSNARKAKARQLKGYLYFFEQILVNYLQQLNHVKRLLAVDAGDNLTSYVTKLAYEIPGMSYLFSELDSEPGGQYLVEFSISDRLQRLVEDPNNLPERLNRLHDQLLARFQASIADWTGRFWTIPRKSEAETRVATKRNFLRNYSQLGMNRAGAMNYGQKSSKSGFVDRIRALLGWDVEGHPMRNVGGFWVLEHLLLRPRTLEDQKLKPRSSKKLPGFDLYDPWSCRLAVVIDMDQMGFAESDEAKGNFQRLIREELPAHLGLEFIWIGHLDAIQFETDFNAWLNAYDAGMPWDSSGIVTHYNQLKNRWGGICKVLPSKKKSQLEPNTPLAVVYDDEGEIVKAWVNKYSEPRDPLEISSEVELNRKTGEVIFTGAKTMEGLEDFRLNFATMNIAGGITHHSIKLNIVQDARPVYTIYQFDFEIEAAMKVASVNDADNTIVIAEMLKGNLPPGTELNLVSGDIEVISFPKLKAELEQQKKISSSLVIRLTNDENFVQEMQLDFTIYAAHDLFVKQKYEDTFAITQFIHGRNDNLLFAISDVFDDGIKAVEFYGFAPESKGVIRDPKAFGLNFVLSGDPRNLEIVIDDFNLFSDVFFKVASPDGTSMTTGLIMDIYDGLGLKEELVLPLKFRIDHDPDIVYAPAKEYKSYIVGDSIAMVRDLNDGGIVEMPNAGRLPGLEWFSAIPVITNIPQYKLLVNDARVFVKWVENDFTLNFSTDSYHYLTTIETWDIFEGKTIQPFEIIVLRGAIGSGTSEVTVSTLSWKSFGGVSIDAIQGGFVIAEARLSDDGVFVSGVKAVGDSLAGMGISLRMKDDLCEFIVTNPIFLRNAFYGPEAQFNVEKNQIIIAFSFKAKVKNSDDLEVNAMFRVAAGMEKGIIYYNNNVRMDSLELDEVVLQVYPAGIEKLNITDIEVSGFLNPGLETERLSSGGGLIRVEKLELLAGGIFDYELAFKEGSKIVETKTFELKLFAETMEMHIERNLGDPRIFTIDLAAIFPGINSRVYTSYTEVPYIAAKCARQGLKIEVEVFNDYFLKKNVGYIKAYLYLPEMGAETRVTLYIYLHADI